MTTEDDFQAALDAHPDDWQTRLVFADWLQDRDDRRAEGYRALGKNRRAPGDSVFNHWWYTDRRQRGDFEFGENEAADLSDDWYWLTAPLSYDRLPGDRSTCACWRTRREAEDAAALAFVELHADRRAELLTTEKA